MSGDKPWSLRPRKSDRLAATAISSNYGSSSRKKSSLASARVSSNSSVSYVDSGSGEETDNNGLLDPADLLDAPPPKPAKPTKARKCSVDAMDVDEEPAAPPNKKANRAAKGGSAVSNAVETSSKAKERPLPCPKFAGARSAGERTVDPRRAVVSSSVNTPAASSSSAARPRTRTIDLDSIELEEALCIDDSFDFEIKRSKPPGISRMYEFTIQDAEDIGRTYKPLEVNDASTFRKMMEFFSMPGFALSRTGEWLHSTGGSLPNLVTFYNTLHILLVVVQYRYGSLDPLEPLPADPNHHVYFDGSDPQPRWKHYTRETFPPFNGQRFLVMGKYDEAWQEYRRAFAEHERSENGKEAAFTAKQKALYSEWEEHARIYLLTNPGVIGEVEHRLNTLGCYILFRIRAQFKHEDQVLESAFPPLPSSQPSYKPPPRAPATPPPPSTSRNRGKVVVEAPAIAVLDAAPVSDSDNEPLSASRSAKGKGKGKIIVVPRSSSKKAAERASSERAASDRAESDKGEESDGEELDPITQSVKVKRGRKTVTIELTGPRNRYDSSEWHVANDLFVYAWPTTGSGNKIVTHGYPFDEKHPRFSRTWKRQVTLASLPVCAFFMRGRGCVRCYLGGNDCVRLRYGEEPPTGACAHCRADNTSCVRCPIEFDWTVTDAVLPEINAEYLELQQALMLDITEEITPVGTTERPLGLVLRQLRLLGTEADVMEARHAAFGGAFAAHPDGRSEYKLSGAFTRGGDDEGSTTEVEEKAGDDGNMAMPEAGEHGVSNEGPLPSVSVTASGPSTPPAALPVCLSLGAPDSASRRSPGDPVRLFSPTAPSRRSNTPRPRSPGFFQTRASPTVAISTPDLTSSSFGKPGPILGGNSSETSEGSVSITFPLGEVDAEGEIEGKGVVVDGVPGAEGDMHVD
ncbi:hypothetical protein B0H13DRAFT_1894016 [Mycena leptocephala]|nr:hypothetical protein B0H13DRAFT_1894016 [Mycena leptocephala]